MINQLAVFLGTPLVDCFRRQLKTAGTEREVLTHEKWGADEGPASGVVRFEGEVTSPGHGFSSPVTLFLPALVAAPCSARQQGVAASPASQVHILWEGQSTSSWLRVQFLSPKPLRSVGWKVPVSTGFCFMSLMLMIYSVSLSTKQICNVFQHKMRCSFYIFHHKGVVTDVTRLIQLV